MKVRRDSVRDFLELFPLSWTISEAFFGTRGTPGAAFAEIRNLFLRALRARLFADFSQAP